jgi:hypothetical protein
MLMMNVRVQVIEGSAMIALTIPLKRRQRSISRLSWALPPAVSR